MAFEKIEGFTFPSDMSFREVLDDLQNFEVYDDDIWICSFPKSGTTWTQEMVWMITHDLDFKSAEVDNDIRMPYLELSGFLKPFMRVSNEIDLDYLSNSIEFSKNAKRPRILKTHVPFQLLPKQIQTFEKHPKIIYVYRNMKDSCVSSYHYSSVICVDNDFIDFEDFCKLFIEGKVTYAPMIESVKSYWKHKDNTNFLFLRFEDMKTDLRSVILDVCKFLNKTLSDDDISKLMGYLSFEKMKNNTYVDKHVLHDVSRKYGGSAEGNFYRRGEIGSYKEDMTLAIENAFDEHLKKNLADTDLQL